MKMFIKTILSWFTKPSFAEFVEETLNNDEELYCFIGYDGFQVSFFTVASARSFRHLWSHSHRKPYGMTKKDVEFCSYLWNKSSKYSMYPYSIIPYNDVPPVEAAH